MIICSSCGSPLSAGLDFCSECGAEVPRLDTGASTINETSANISVPPIDYAHQPPPKVNEYVANLVASPAQPGARPPKFLIIALGLTTITALAVAAYFMARSRSSASNSSANVAASLQSAVDSGRLVTLSSDDAYTYFFRLRDLEPQQKILSEIKPRVLPQLRRLGDEVFGKRASMGLEVLTERDWTIALHAYEWAHVLEESDKAIEARWKYAEGHVAKAQNRRDDAQNSFYAATQLDSSWALPVNDLGYLYVLSKKYSEAIPYYQRAISLQPDWDIPYNNMGTANYYQQNYEAAEMWYRKAIEVNAKWATPHVWLGSIYENRGLKSAAIEEYQTTLNLYNPNRDRVNTVEIQNKINALRGY